MLGDLGVAARGALGEPHDPLDPRGRLAGVAREQVVDDRSGAGVDREQLDPHRPARVVAAPHEASLLEHPDEHARVVVAGRQLRRVDGAAGVADRAVHAPQVVRRGNVADREAAHGGGVGRAREQERVARRAVAAAAPDHLHVALERVGVVEEADEPDVRLVDAHPECRRRDDATDAAADEVVLHPGPLVCLEAGVVVLEPEPVAASVRATRSQESRERAYTIALPSSPRPQPLDENAQAILVAADLLDVVAEVRPDDARAHDGEVAAERSRDLCRRGGVAVAVMPSTLGSPSASSARRMKR